MKRARIRPRQSAWHTFVFMVSGAAIGFSLWAYWQLAQETLNPPKPAEEDGQKGPSAELQEARAEYRRAYLDPLVHVRLAERHHKEGRIVDGFLVLDAARAFFGEARFAVAHAFVVLENDPTKAEAAPGGPAWATGAVADYLRQARAMTTRAEFDAALKGIDSALILTPNDTGLVALKALILSRFTERAAEAMPLYRGLAIIDPAAPDGRLAVEFLAKRAHWAATEKTPEGARSGDPSGTQAVETLERLGRERPEDPRIFQNLAMLRWTQGRLDEVRKMTDEALAKDPKHAGALSMSGALALADQDAEKAIARLEEALQSEPGDLYAALKLAELRQYFKSEPRSALALWIQVHRLDPWRLSQGRLVSDIVRSNLAGQASEALAGAEAERILRAMSAENAAVRAEACFAAGRSGDSRFIEPLGNMLDDDVELVRGRADEALFALGSIHKDAVKQAAFAWLASEKPLVRARAINLAADLFRDEAKPRVLALLNDPDPTLRVVARMALQHYYAADKKAMAELTRSHNEETSELAWALLSTRALRRPLEPEPEPEEPAEPEPEVKPRPKPKPPPPPTAAPHKRKGLAALKAGRIGEAVGEYERADAIEPGDPETLLGLARAFSRSQEAPKAAVALRRCLGAARSRGPNVLKEYLRLAQNDGQLTYLQSQPSFEVLLRGFKD